VELSVISDGLHLLSDTLQGQGLFRKVDFSTDLGRFGVFSWVAEPGSVAHRVIVLFSCDLDYTPSPNVYIRCKFVNFQTAASDLGRKKAKNVVFLAPAAIHGCVTQKRSRPARTRRFRAFRKVWGGSAPDGRILNNVTYLQTFLAKCPDAKS